MKLRRFVCVCVFAVRCCCDSYSLYAELYHFLRAKPHIRKKKKRKKNKTRGNPETKFLVKWYALPLDKEREIGKGAAVKVIRSQRRK